MESFRTLIGRWPVHTNGHEATQRPDVGVPDQFTTRKPPRSYCDASSLALALSWDENRDRELAECLIAMAPRRAAEVLEVRV